MPINKFMIKLFLAVFLLQFLMSSAISANAANDFDALIGNWRGEREEEAGSRFRTVGEITFHEEGSFIGSADRQRHDGANSNDSKCISFTGRWHVDQGMVVFTDVEYSDGLIIQFMRNRIIEVSEDRLQLKDVADGSVYNYRRIDKRTHECIVPPSQVNDRGDLQDNISTELDR